MGVIICKKHGQQFVDLVPPALRQAVLDRKPLSRHQLHKVRNVYLDGDEETWFWCDAASVERHSIPLGRVLTEDEYWRLSERIPLQPVCCRCLDESLSKNDEKATDS